MIPTTDKTKSISQLSPQQLSELNTLIRRNFDARKGYMQAAKQVEDNLSLKRFLEDYAKQRQDFIIDLKNLVSELGGTPADQSSIEGDLHRNWINIRTALAAKEEKAVLDECQRGEKAALDSYQKVRDIQNFPAPVYTMLDQHLKAIQSAMTTMESLERAYH